MLKLSFYGGAQEVTGANYLLESDPSTSSGQATKLLVDCGLFQGSKIAEDKNRAPFDYDPKSINALFVTHSHIDHIGRIPKLVKEGFGGTIYSTPPTKDLAEIMLIDSLGVLEKEAQRDNKEVFYNQEDVRQAMSQWQAIDYHQEFEVQDFKVNFKNAGHILGSAMIEIIYGGATSVGGSRTSVPIKIVFTGDLGNPPAPLLRPPEEVNDADFLIIESTYGDKVHEDRKERKIKLERAIEDAVKAGGVLMMPAFSLERTQEILFELNDLVEHGRIPQVPIFLDSPLAIMATEIYKKYENYFNQEAKYVINSGDEIFKFPGLKMTKTTEESKSINEIPAPKVIIAGSGMSNGGRIIHHERRYLSDPKNTLLLVGYQSAGSLGRILQDGAKSITILGDKIEVRAKIEVIRGYSAHPDQEGLVEFVQKSAETLKQVFVVQGESSSSLFFVQRVRDYLGLNAQSPKYGDSIQLL
ncbi:MAG: RNA-metabolising metallo-beta-lactamase [Parcubacteria group bacterium GW2011_GWB1_41_6]|nr:MAG: RNA-metabolising metallo-beta-lactamase [Parcubacteria group bacterium GW2011_GWB1_41_6]KKS34672.1 MAG: RNA-metabolising metallo-beta-lactamase [Parcubacteria group bacterium GW2011_GWC2_42_13]KKS57999.1 MAG: RNA-metabolising metallo-beta-lactamase [Parcubacteria group bacterium GW2011_GWA2_42_35]